MTRKQKNFIERYLGTGNATEAAFYSYNTKSKNVAGVIGHKLLRNVNVKKETELSFEAEKPIIVSIARMLKNAIDQGSPKEQLRAAEIVLKLRGLI